MKIDGGCHCSAITYRAEIDPENVLILSLIHISEPTRPY